MEFPQRGEIYFVDFSPTGTGEMAGRHPALHSLRIERACES